MPPAAAGYSYDELARRISAVLQIPPPSLSTLRAAAAEARRTPGTKCQARLTYGMPPPQRVDGHVVFERAAVETWLANHPRQSSQAAIARLRRAVDAGCDLRTAIEEARRESLSWRAIADTLTKAGIPRSAQALHKAFRPPPLSCGPAAGRDQRDLPRTPA